MTPEEHQRLWPDYPGNRDPGHGTALHRWWVRTNCQAKLRALERGMDELDRKTQGRALTDAEAAQYREGANLRVGIVATLKAHGG